MYKIRSRIVLLTWADGNFCFEYRSVRYTRLCFKFSFCYYFIFNCIVLSVVGNGDFFRLVLFRLHVPHNQFAVCFYFPFGIYCFIYTLITHFQRLNKNNCLSFPYLKTNCIFHFSIYNLSGVPLFQIKFKSNPIIKHSSAKHRHGKFRLLSPSYYYLAITYITNPDCHVPSVNTLMS